jgi:hypothetical protein
MTPAPLTAAQMDELRKRLTEEAWPYFGGNHQPVEFWNDDFPAFLNFLMEQMPLVIDMAQEWEAWRPIESAPKDGTQFLTWNSFYGIRVGKAHLRANHDDWLSYCDAFKGSSKGGSRATHWMPLPIAPTERVDG